MPTRARSNLATALITAAFVSPAAACPVCNTGTGEQVRDGLADEHLGVGVLAVALPFVALGGLVAAVHLGFPDPRPHDRSTTRGRNDDRTA